MKAVCDELTTGSTSLPSIVWIMRMHVEAVIAKGVLARSEVRVADTVCQELRQCVKWVDPDENRRKEIEQHVEAVYS